VSEDRLLCLAGTSFCGIVRLPDWLFESGSSNFGICSALLRVVKIMIYVWDVGECVSVCWRRLGGWGAERADRAGRSDPAESSSKTTTAAAIMIHSRNVGNGCLTILFFFSIFGSRRRRSCAGYEIHTTQILTHTATVAFTT